MILQPTTEQSPLNRILCLIAAFFGIGIALITLNAFYEALSEYNAIVMRVLAFSAIVLILSFVAYVSMNIYLTIEYRATENEIFKESRQQLQIANKTALHSNNSKFEDDKERKVLELYDEMTFTNSLSYNQLALEVFGTKGGSYTKQIKDILVKNGREI